MSKLKYEKTILTLKGIACIVLAILIPGEFLGLRWEFFVVGGSFLFIITMIFCWFEKKQNKITPPNPPI